MPMFDRRRPLKRWRYIGAYAPDVMACVGDAHIGPFRQRFWAVCEPGRPVLARTTLGRGGVTIEGSRALVETPELRIDLTVEEHGGVETTHPSGDSYVWTRKQAGVPVRGHVKVNDRSFTLDCLGAVDDTAGYHQRHTTWSWSAGVGRATTGERIGWNLVTGVNDEPVGSERCVWIDGAPAEVGPVEFADDLSRVTFAEGGALDFASWGAREDHTNLLLLRSSYRQPFGTFSGVLPGGVELAEGYGVMEWHDVWW
jgi:hypothetical protein